ANPDAPKGGQIRLARIGTFDSFNPFIPKGAPFGAISVELLGTRTQDDPNVEYGLIAETFEVPDDRSWLIVNLNPRARWHDGKAITAEDVVWTFETLMDKGRPSYRFYYANVISAEKLGHRRVKFSFDEKNNRELPIIVLQLPVLPKHYWESRDFEKTTLDPPLGSGPYRIASFEPGRFVVLERVEDYWGADLPVKRGTSNFDRIRFDYFRDFTPLRQALKGGDIDYSVEHSSKHWAVDYDVPAVRKGWLHRELMEHGRPSGMQAFVFNTRREKFKDARVRQALGLAFDFQWMNEHIFYSFYSRTTSYFENSELASSGLPQDSELEILERFRDRLPEAVFTTPFEVPQTDGSGWPRANLRKAFALLAQAGFEVRDFKMVDKKSAEPLRFELLLGQPGFDRVALPWIRNLERLGVTVTLRLVDRSQFVNRLRSFDFDVVVSTWGQSESPGNEQRDYWGSEAADSPDGSNLAGIKDPVVDELIDLIIGAPDRDALIARTRALDRVLLHSHYIVPNWHSRKDRVLWWDKFSFPQTMPKYGVTTDTWWYDEAKAERLAQARRANASIANDKTPSAEDASSQ
ncbi:MAG: extracellular solute-binding protein, partial [Gammaproteobacteria bacterium]